MKKRLLAGGMIFSMILVIGAVIYLNAAPRWCHWDDENYCENWLGGTFFVYFDFVAYYMGNPVNVYDMYCSYDWRGMGPEPQWWGLCYDINGIYD